MGTDGYRREWYEIGYKNDSICNGNGNGYCNDTIGISLADKCCHMISLEISKSCSPGYIDKILDCIPNGLYIKKIWGRLMDDRNDSLQLFITFVKYMIKNGFKLNDSMNYRFQFIQLESINLDPSIIYLNSNVDSNFVTCMTLDCNAENLLHLVNLNSLHSLSLTTHASTSLETVVYGWRRSILVNENRWKNLKYLCLPDLSSPKLFHELFSVLPSLVIFEVSLPPNVVNEIPLLSMNYMHKKIDYNSSSAFKKASKLDLLGITDEKIIIDINIGSTGLSRTSYNANIEKTDYYIQKAKETYCYIKKKKPMLKRGIQMNNKIETRNKRVRMPNIKMNTSVNSFFGFK
ncbi:hypothetical protein Kpol_309p3 [Vanderwaltozyma polyspora DSM 70294]|uniref:Uncharacterized protein n=1 Tax=Vanderwaltozyma polyspora (strain ATCC 22028 / DSM 70294 / BCRC 21397 / CBS 2163 / NBRC 10782 / NRRL Y-8283 / UCD 57-17) TaxID=436907 RepID=A7TSW9_VANPO|nr:uncharacterized protein Kpol_309p3 [Vanderwaltozyma polyspora DSM 70294]EDO14635.1 hypothetical protein Kpol_309p3 [Vanderwaltozyma polyspora DSM 70294]